MAERGGIMLRVDGALAFVPAAIAVKVVPVPKVTRVVGAPAELLGIALHEGQTVPVVAIGSARHTMVVCTIGGESIGLVGGEVISAGMTPDESTRSIDLAAIYARIQAGGWATRWAG
jgi:chemotaxis signal transduction protein